MKTVQKNSILLQAFEGTNTTVPVWFMRQAGRYLPEYQNLKAQYSLEELFRNSELAAKITCLPIDTLNVDAAIMFADILTLPEAMGVKINFHDQKGPIIECPSDFKKIHDFDNLSHIEKTIQLVLERLPENVPLIGFAGSPFTVLTYLLEGKSSSSFQKTFRCMYQQPKLFHTLMSLLTKNTINYLKLQQRAGIDVYQIFDTWVGILRPADYAHYVFPYVQEIFKSIDLPSIYFAKNAHHLLELMNQTNVDVLSLGHTAVLGHQKILKKTSKGVQGNLFNGLLFADQNTLRKEVLAVLAGAKNHNRFIFNLSHGVLPHTPVENLKLVVETVHAYPWEQS